jgi:hypothetical protein
VPTAQEWEHVRVLSDSVLYKRALDFVASVPAVENKQVNSLLEFSRTIFDLLEYVQHQRDRKWSDRESNMKKFYTALYDAVFRIVRDTKDLWKFVPADVSEVEAQKRTSIFATLLAREFIQHLVAEMLYARRPMP